MIIMVKVQITKEKSRTLSQMASDQNSEAWIYLNDDNKEKTNSLYFLFRKFKFCLDKTV